MYRFYLKYQFVSKRCSKFHIKMINNVRATVYYIAILLESKVAINSECNYHLPLCMQCISVSLKALGLLLLSEECYSIHSSIKALVTKFIYVPRRLTSSSNSSSQLIPDILCRRLVWGQGGQSSTWNLFAARN